MTVYAHRPKLNNATGMELHSCFYFGGKKQHKKEKRAQ